MGECARAIPKLSLPCVLRVTLGERVAAKLNVDSPKGFELALTWGKPVSFVSSVPLVHFKSALSRTNMRPWAVLLVPLSIILVNGLHRARQNIESF